MDVFFVVPDTDGDGRTAFVGADRPGGIIAFYYGNLTPAGRVVDRKILGLP